MLRGGKVENKPIFCRDCGSKDSFIKDMLYSMRTESGVVIEQCWRCVKCNHVTFRPPVKSEVETK